MQLPPSRHFDGPSRAPRSLRDRRSLTGWVGAAAFALGLVLPGGGGAAAGDPASPSPGPAPVELAERSPWESAAPVPKPVALDAAAEAWVEETLASLDLRARVAQLVMPWIPGGRMTPGSNEYRRMRRWIEEDGIGGLIVSRGPVGEFATALNAAQRMSRVPLLVVSDLETGPGMRLTGGSNFPPAMAFGAAGSEALAAEAGRVTGREARAAGIHMTLGPVLDVNSNPLNPIINIRSFGEDPREVARLGSAWIRGAREEGLLSAGKHFPGHGDTEVDSHMGLPFFQAGPERLWNMELVPFRAAMEAGMDGVLVGHIAITGIDGADAPPASMSAGVVGGLLREGLGFDGLVFTDALNMRAITRRYTVPEASIRAIEAGVDVLLQPPGERAVIDAILEAVESGRLSPERIEESARRVLRAKAAAGLHEGVLIPPTAHRDVLARGNHEQAVGRVAEASLTLVRDETDLVPLPAGARRILHVVYTATGSRFDAPGFNAELRQGGRTVDAARVDPGTTARAFEALLQRARAADLVIVSANVIPREYVGTVDLRGGIGGFAERLVAEGKPVVAVSFGNPYLLPHLPGVPAYLLAWSAGGPSQRGAARALLGSLPIPGTLPVTLSGEHAVGSGLRRP